MDRHFAIRLFEEDPVIAYAKPKEALEFSRKRLHAVGSRFRITMNSLQDRHRDVLRDCANLIRDLWQSGSFSQPALLAGSSGASMHVGDVLLGTASAGLEVASTALTTIAGRTSAACRTGPKRFMRRTSRV